MSQTETLDSIAAAARRIAAKRPRSGRGVPEPINQLAWRRYDKLAALDKLDSVARELWAIVERLEQP